ncbi:MAG: carbamoyl-phosphate synthase small subunit [Bradymonadia bacterium]|jgi:carbamoyl-phosphate synthase small subunit
MRRAVVVLSDGATFEGEPLGAEGVSLGEVVFNTSMTGYQEILTDPSYRGQIITMTPAHVGNYGCNPLDVESAGVQVAGFIVRSASRVASNFRATHTLHEYLCDAGVVGITGVDTRALTKHIRERGAVMGCVASGAEADDVDALKARIAAAPAYGERDPIAEVSVPEPKRVFLDATTDPYVKTSVRFGRATDAWPSEQSEWPHVAVIDFGVKFSILRCLAETGVRVTVLPHTTTAADVDSGGFDGVLVSNGPGDPGRMDAAVERVRGMLNARPIFGICLGHQLVCRALGAETFKLKFGHRGPNQPVKDQASGRVEITAQNHGYAVRPEGLPKGAIVTHVNLNDGTIEGIDAPDMRVFSVQHHPEAGPGPNDAVHMFTRFRERLV